MQKLTPIPQPAAAPLKLPQPTLDRDDALFLISQDDVAVGDIRVDLYAMHSSAGWQLLAVCPTGSDLNLQSALSEQKLLDLEAWCNQEVAAPDYRRAA